VLQRHGYREKPEIGNPDPLAHHIKRVFKGDAQLNLIGDQLKDLVQRRCRFGAHGMYSRSDR